MGRDGVEQNEIGWSGTGSVGKRWNERLGIEGREGMGWNG